MSCSWLSFNELNMKEKRNWERARIFYRAMKRARDLIRNRSLFLTNRLEHLVRTKRWRHPLRCDNLFSHSVHSFRFSFVWHTCVRVCLRNAFHLSTHVYHIVVRHGITMPEPEMELILLWLCLSWVSLCECVCVLTVVVASPCRNYSTKPNDRVEIFGVCRTHHTLALHQFHSKISLNPHRKVLTRFSFARCMLTCWIIIFVSRCCCSCCCKIQFVPTNLAVHSCWTVFLSYRKVIVARVTRSIPFCVENEISFCMRERYCLLCVLIDWVGERACRIEHQHFRTLWMNQFG